MTKPHRTLGSLLHSTAHVISYSTWLLGQIVKESLTMAKDTFTTGRNIAPVIIYYPLRITSEVDVAAFIASITMTPGTMALGVTGPKEVDDDALAGTRHRQDICATGPGEFRTHGLARVQRFLAVHAMYGSDPQELLHELAVMEAKLAPEVKQKSPEFDVEHLVERGVPGPRGYRGTHGGRASEDSVFAVEKVDSTPHATAFVAAIMRADDELDVADLPDLSAEDQEKIAREHAEKVTAQRRADQKRRREARAALAAMGDEDTSIYERAAEGITTGHPLFPVDRGDPADRTPGGGTDRTPASPVRRRHPGTPANASLINAFEARARLPQPRLNLSRKSTGKNPTTKPDPKEKDQ